MERISAVDAAPDAFKAVYALEKFGQHCGIEKSLIHLVKLRASQMNGCAFCIDMHASEARRDGESEKRLYALCAWRDTAFFTKRERAALGWTEEVTRLAPHGVSQEAYEALKAEFSEKEMVELTVIIGTINLWNRMSVSFRRQPG